MMPAKLDRVGIPVKKGGMLCFHNVHVSRRDWTCSSLFLLLLLLPLLPTLRRFFRAAGSSVFSTFWRRCSVTKAWLAVPIRQDQDRVVRRGGGGDDDDDDGGCHSDDTGRDGEKQSERGKMTWCAADGDGPRDLKSLLSLRPRRSNKECQYVVAPRR